MSGYLSEQHKQSSSRDSSDGNDDTDSDTDSNSSSELSTDSEYLEKQAMLEWEENVRQLQLAVSVLIMPTVGRYFGRKWAYGIYARYITAGWNWRVLLPGSWSGILAAMS